MDVSVIIINYKTPQLLIDCFNSIKKQTSGVKYEIIVVDNDSGDNSVARINESIQVDKIICSTTNVGFGRANNLGVKHARGKYIFLLNSDTILINNALKILFDFMEDNQECGICGGNLYDQDLNPTHSFMPRILSLQDEFDILAKIERLLNKKKFICDFNYSGSNMDVGYITGADMFIRKDVFDKCNGFDPDFFMYYEEVELTNRIKKLGYTVTSVPEAKIIHLEGKSCEFKEARYRMKMESKYKYFSKVYSNSTCSKAYLLSQFKNCVSLFDNGFIQYKINREEYKKWKKNLDK